MNNDLESLLKNEEFAAKLEKVEFVVDAVSLFAKEGVTVSADELNGYINNAEGEVLTEEELEDVPGGCAVYLGIRIIRGIINSTKRSSGGGGKGSFGGGGGGGGR